MSTKSIVLAGAFLLGVATSAFAGYEGIELGSYKPTNGAVATQAPSKGDAYAQTRQAPHVAGPSGWMPSGPHDMVSGPSALGAGADHGGSVHPGPGHRDSDGNKGSGWSTPDAANARIAR